MHISLNLKYNYRQCSFKVEPDKVNTARVIVWKEFHVTNSFTLESSIYGYNIGDEIVRFSEREYIRIGEALMQALNAYKELIEELQSEMSINKNWLKPGRLIELTGTPAAEALKLEILEDKRRERREKIRVKVQMNKIPSFQKVDSRAPAKPSYSSKSRMVFSTENNKSFESNLPNIKKPKQEAQSGSENPVKKQHCSMRDGSGPSRKSSDNNHNWEDYFSESEIEEITKELSNNLPKVSGPGEHRRLSNCSQLPSQKSNKADTSEKSQKLPEEQSAKVVVPPRVFKIAQGKSKRIHSGIGNANISFRSCEKPIKSSEKIQKTQQRDLHEKKSVYRPQTSMLQVQKRNTARCVQNIKKDSEDSYQNNEFIDKCIRFYVTMQNQIEKSKNSNSAFRFRSTG